VAGLHYHRDRFRNSPEAPYSELIPGADPGTGLPMKNCRVPHLLEPALVERPGRPSFQVPVVFRAYESFYRATEKQSILADGQVKGANTMTSILTSFRSPEKNAAALNGVVDSAVSTEITPGSGRSPVLSPPNTLSRSPPQMKAVDGVLQRMDEPCCVRFEVSDPVFFHRPPLPSGAQQPCFWAAFKESFTIRLRNLLLLDFNELLGFSHAHAYPALLRRLHSFTRLVQQMIKSTAEQAHAIPAEAVALAAASAGLYATMLHDMWRDRPFTAAAARIKPLVTSLRCMGVVFMPPALLAGIGALAMQLLSSNRLQPLPADAHLIPPTPPTHPPTPTLHCSWTGMHARPRRRHAAAWAVPHHATAPTAGDRMGLQERQLPQLE
jgi:hypothetical protein